MVRLKVMELVEQAPVDKLFQFQYGTIKSQTGGKTLILRALFQFQYGTIKSFTFYHPAYSSFYFNSSMVRLKDSFV